MEWAVRLSNYIETSVEVLFHYVPDHEQCQPSILRTVLSRVTHGDINISYETAAQAYAQMRSRSKSVLPVTPHLILWDRPDTPFFFMVSQASPIGVSASEAAIMAEDPLYYRRGPFWFLKIEYKPYRPSIEDLTRVKKLNFDQLADAVVRSQATGISPMTILGIETNLGDWPRQ